jgi:hypothetical protein
MCCNAVKQQLLRRITAEPNSSVEFKIVHVKCGWQMVLNDVAKLPSKVVSKVHNSGIQALVHNLVISKCFDVVLAF